MPAGRLVGWTVDRQGERALVAMSDSHDELLAVTKLYLVDLLGGQPPLLLRESTREIGYGPGEFSPDGTRALIGRSRTWTQSATLASTTEVLDLRTGRSEEHTSELQSRGHLVCRLLLEKKNKHKIPNHTRTGHKPRA